MPRVALIAVSGFRVREPEMAAIGMALPGLAPRAAAIGALPALGLLTLAGMTPTDWDITYHEAVGDTASLADAIAAQRPTLAAVSALTASVTDAYALAAALRARAIPTVLGGLHATTCPDEAAQHFDSVCIGDGEPVWLDILADARRGRLKPIYRAPAPFDLAAAPLPRLDLLGGGQRPRYTLQTARGCPMACEFCGASRLLGHFREKPLDRIKAELDQIRTLYPRATIELADDNTFAGGRDAGTLLSVFVRSGLRWFTECDWRIGERPDVLARLAGAGCVQVLIGVESVAHAFSGMGAKRAPVPRILDAVNRIQDAGVAVIGCFVVGADSDDAESIYALGEWLLDAPFADVQLTLQTPFPGTPLRRRLEAEDRLLPARGWNACTLFDVAFRPARMSVDDLERAFRSVVKAVFSQQPFDRRSAIRRGVWASRYRLGVPT